MNEVTLQFVNTALTPICESLRADKAKIDDLMVSWFDGINAGVPNDSTVLQTGPTRYALLPLTGAQITAAVAVIQQIQTLLNAPGVMQILTRPTSHPLGAQ